MDDLINDIGTLSFNEFSFKKEKTWERYEKIGESIIEKLKEKLSFFEKNFFYSNEKREKFYLFRPYYVFKLNKKHFIKGSGFPDISESIAEDISNDILDDIFLFCIGKFSLKKINDFRMQELLKEYDNKYIRKGFCFDKNFFKKISIVLDNILCREQFEICKNYAENTDLIFRVKIFLTF